MMLAECCKNQWRTWTRCLLVSGILLLLLILTIVGFIQIISAKAMTGTSGEELISELMSKHYETHPAETNLSPLDLPRGITNRMSHSLVPWNDTVEEEEEEIEVEEIIMHPLDIWIPPPEMSRDFKYYFAGYDKQHLPVWIIPFGTWNISSYLDADEENLKIVEMYAYQFVHRVNQSRMQFQDPPGHVVPTGFVLMSDMAEYSLAEFASVRTASLYLKLSTMFASHMAEMEYGFAVNLDWIALMLVEMLRPILQEVMDKMSFFGMEKEEYIPALLDKISPHQLPTIYGGSEEFQPLVSYG